VNVKLLLFDLDDTLVDHSSALENAARHLARELQLGIDEASFADRWRRVHADKYPQYLAGQLTYERMCRERIWKAVNPDLAPPEADRLFRIYFDAYTRLWRLFDDVWPCLDALRTVPIGIVTNGRSAEQQLKVERLGLRDRVSLLAISEETKSPKPRREAFLGPCATFGIRPNEAVFLGDNYDIDFRGASNAGLVAIWLNRKGEQGDGRQVRSLLDVPALLARM